MANYRTTVILKTDIVDSTPRLADQTQTEMVLERKHHKKFVADIAIKHRGLVFQDEGDAYWIEFPSVTDAALAAIETHQTLRSNQAGRGGRQRLAIRAVITVGDILHQEKDAIGMVMSLTARIEKVTPPDEIYLSHAAWLVLNKAEVQTSFVDEFQLKGFSEPEKVYKVDQKFRTRVLTNQYIVFTDIRGWSSYTKSRTVEDVEGILFNYDDLLNEICDRHGGIIRNTSGDQYFLTFSEADELFAAVEQLCTSWKHKIGRHQLGLSVAIHRGDLNIIRSYLYSNDIHATYFLERLNGLMQQDTGTISVVASGRAKENANGTKWEGAFQEVDASKITDEHLRSVIKEYGAYGLILQDGQRA